jgi:DNA-binding transcriptional MerR regulator
VETTEPRFSLRELVDSSGLSERTIRYYIQQGVIDPALGRGRSRYFTTSHLQQVEMVARMRKDRLSIDEIRQRLQAPHGHSPLSGNADAWERITLHPDLEIHLRASAPDSVRAFVQRMAVAASEWFGEDDQADEEQ